MGEPNEDFKILKMDCAIIIINNIDIESNESQETTDLINLFGLKTKAM